MTSSKPLEGRVAIVTGGAAGIGLATVRRLRADGALVVAGDLQAPAHDVDGVTTVLGDLSTREACERLVATAVDTHGRLDIVVNNVGAAPTRERFEAVDDGDWEATWQLNVMSAVRTTRAAIAPLRASGGGAIVMVSSTTARLAEPSWVDYAVSKAALLVLAKALSVELGPSRIRVNSVAPGSIRTPLWDRPGGFSDALAERYGLPVEEAIARYVEEERDIPLQDVGRPEDVGAAIAYLVSDDAAYVTGAELAVHGGSIRTI